MEEDGGIPSVAEGDGTEKVVGTLGGLRRDGTMQSVGSVGLALGSDPMNPLAEASPTEPRK